MKAILTVAVLSYNRGPWLLHCLNSVGECLPDCRVLLIDDNSDDPDTRTVLDSLPRNVRLIHPDRAETGVHGGLYPNMQRALAACETPLILYLQDDTQVVRKVDAAELIAWRSYMERAGKPFLGPLFVQGRQARGLQQRIAPLPDLRAYVQINSSVTNAKPVAYRDVVLAHAGLLQAAGWQFRLSERDTARAARDRWGAMPILLAPFVAFSPEVPTFRNRQRTFGARLAEARLGRGPKPFAPMTADSIVRLKTMPFGIRTTASFLIPAGTPPRPGDEPNAVDVFPLLRQLDRLETRLRRLFRRHSS